MFHQLPLVSQGGVGTPPSCTMPDLDIDYFPEKIPFRMSVKERPDRYVYASYFRNIYASVHTPDSSSEFYLIEESDGYCRIESAKYRGFFLKCSLDWGVNIRHTSEMTSGCLFIIACRADGYLDIKCKLNTHYSLTMVRWSSNVFAVPFYMSLDLCKVNDSARAKWKLTAAGVKEEVFHQQTPTRVVLPRDQRLKTSSSDVIHVLNYSVPSNDRTMLDINRNYSAARPRAEQLIANHCVFGKYTSNALFLVFVLIDYILHDRFQILDGWRSAGKLCIKTPFISRLLCN